MYIQIARLQQYEIICESIYVVTNCQNYIALLSDRSLECARKKGNVWQMSQLFWG